MFFDCSFNPTDTTRSLRTSVSTIFNRYLVVIVLFSEILYQTICAKDFFPKVVVVDRVLVAKKHLEFDVSTYLINFAISPNPAKLQAKLKE